MRRISFIFIIVFSFLHNSQCFRLARNQASFLQTSNHRGVSQLQAVIDPNHLQQHTEQISHLLSNSFQLADAAVSAYSKVDKTGFIGTIASYIEVGIDLGRDLFRAIGIENAYGPSILLFTIIVKILTFPLQYQTLESTTKLQKIQPLQQKVMEKYANDPQTKNLVLSQLLQAAKVNPLAGCFPALVQIPIFISLYRSLTNLVAENKLGESFLWIPDLQGPVYTKPPSESLDWLKSIATGNPELGWEHTIAFLTIPVLLFISQSISQKLLQPAKDPNKPLSEQEQFSQGLVNNLPLIVTFFSLSVPAGLEVYWIANNIFSTLITLAVKKTLKDEPFPIEVERIMATIDGGNKAAEPDFIVPNSNNQVFRSVLDDRPKPSGFGKLSNDISEPTNEVVTTATEVSTADVTTASNPSSESQADATSAPTSRLDKEFKSQSGRRSKVRKQQRN